MMLSPLPEHARQRRFKLSHGKLIEEDDFDDDEENEKVDAEDAKKEEADS